MGGRPTVPALSVARLALPIAEDLTQGPDRLNASNTQFIWIKSPDKRSRNNGVEGGLTRTSISVVINIFLKGWAYVFSLALSLEGCPQ